jgi:hypothetical protein
MIPCYKFYEDFLKLKIRKSFFKNTQKKEEDYTYWIKLIIFYLAIYILKYRARERSSSFYSLA